MGIGKHLSVLYFLNFFPWALVAEEIPYFFLCSSVSSKIMDAILM